MKTYEERTIPPTPARAEMVVANCVCDLCGKKGDGAWDSGGRWYRSAVANGSAVMTTIRSTIEMAEGKVHAGDATKSTQSFDVCPGCWETKVVPWFASHGAKPNESSVAV